MTFMSRFKIVWLAVQSLVQLTLCGFTEEEQGEEDDEEDAWRRRTWRRGTRGGGRV